MSAAAASETIFARASAPGKAGVAVFRLSGDKSHSIAKALVGKRMKPREAVYVQLRNPGTQAPIDSGLAILFTGPASFTGEDVAEFHLHGARAVEAALFETLAAQGARPAEPGEFSLRALRNGKLDLAQAEALADLIDSETTAQRVQALGQLDGRLSAVAERWRRQLLGVMAPLEAGIDFPDEGDVPDAIEAQAAPLIESLKNALTLFLARSGQARMIREGVSIAILGPPNAGKSSLMNALAGSDVAIVSDIAGTTRDVIETRLDLGGVLATVADTAGLHGRARDAVELEGMARARRRAEAADIRIGVLDPAAPVSRETIALLAPGDVLVWSKADLGGSIPEGMAPDGVVNLSVSAATHENMKALVGALSAKLSLEAIGDDPALTRARHVRAVEEALAALARAQTRLGDAPELAAEDVRMAARALGQITGAVGVEDVLGEIFSSFCIGK